MYCTTLYRVVLWKPMTLSETLLTEFVTQSILYIVLRLYHSDYINMVQSYSETELYGLSRSELQQIAKQYNIKANAKNTILIEQILELQPSTTPPPTTNSTTTTTTPVKSTNEPHTIHILPTTTSKKYTYKQVTPIQSATESEAKPNKKRIRTSSNNEPQQIKKYKFDTTASNTTSSSNNNNNKSNVLSRGAVLKSITNQSHRANNKSSVVPHNHIKSNLSHSANQFNDTFTLKKLHKVINTANRSSSNKLSKINEVGRNPLEQTMVFNIKPNNTSPDNQLSINQPISFVNKSRTNQLANAYRIKQQTKLQQAKQMSLK